jgi:hypothetical protein
MLHRTLGFLALVAFVTTAQASEFHSDYVADLTSSTYDKAVSSVRMHGWVNLHVMPLCLRSGGTDMQVLCLPTATSLCTLPYCYCALRPCADQ